MIEVFEGDARNILCEVVDKHHASLLVVGSHGYGAIKRSTFSFFLSFFFKILCIFPIFQIHSILTIITFLFWAGRFSGAWVITVLITLIARWWSWRSLRSRSESIISVVNVGEKWNNVLASMRETIQDNPFVCVIVLLHVLLL